MAEIATKEAGEPVVIPAFRIHDLRRTAASGMARIGIQPHIIEAVLNHQSGVISGVAGIYNRHAYTDEKAAALAAWVHFLLDLVHERVDRNVVRLIG
jgi:integrase